jgi:hypothetical protein
MEGGNRETLREKGSRMLKEVRMGIETETITVVVELGDRGLRKTSRKSSRSSNSSLRVTSSSSRINT